MISPARHMKLASVLGCYVLLDCLTGTYKRKRPVHLKLGIHKAVQKMRKMLMLFEALLLLPRVPIQSFGDALHPILATSVVG